MALAAVAVLFTLAMFLTLTAAERRIAKLRDWEVSTGDDRPWPAVSIIVTARNEERHLEPALRTLLQLDYPALQVVVVNDRSEDGTGEIVERLAAEDGRVRPVHVSQLPAGWLGKNHAVQAGAEQADGDYLLLTDADVYMEPETLRRAVDFARQRDADHVALLPEVDARGALLQSFINTFAIMFITYFRPWHAANSRSRVYVGIGAFNLIRREAFFRVGGMEPIRMRPDDDMMLGKVLKQNGLRQEVLSGISMVRVPWYESLGEAVRGLEKNAFAGAEYSVVRVMLMTAVCAAAYLLPLLGACFATGPARWLLATCAAAQLLLATSSALRLGLRVWAGLLFPVGVVLLIYTQWRSTWLALWRGGIRWRGTHYSLAELKANRV